MNRAPQWEVDAYDWPHRECSRFVFADGLRWHVQRAGTGPSLLLVHGTGASAHSWRGVLPILAAQFDVIVPDLPGHGFTEAPSASRVADVMSPAGMARALSALLQRLEAAPVLGVGNSAGVVVLLQMALLQGFAPRAILGINAALMPFAGLAGAIFLPLAKLFAGAAWTARFVANQASDRAAVVALIRSTGSEIDAIGVALYQRLLRCSGHVAATLAMMANWDLRSLLPELLGLRVPLVLLVGMKDRAVAPAQAYQVQAAMPQVRVRTWPDLGHLAQEEQPALVAGEILHQAQFFGVLPTPIGGETS
jgi:magnesium chelatase accessory protein